MIKIGLLGAGQVGRRHAQAISKVEGATLVAAADLNEVRAQQAASEHGAIHFSDYRQVLEVDLDAVINCLPHNLHYESSMLAAARALHMLLERLSAPVSLATVPYRWGYMALQGRLPLSSVQCVSLFRSGRLESCSLGWSGR